MSQPQAQLESQQQASDATKGQVQGEAPKRRFNKTRKVTRFLLAVDAWKRGGSILLHRLSFPLMRQVIAGEKRGNLSASQLQEFPTEVLARSTKIHSYLMIMMIPVAAWAFWVTTKGLAAWARFDELTPWLFYGPPLLLFSCGRIFLSSVSRKAQMREILQRQRELTA